MRVAVTGGGGFVGRHVLAELTRRGIAATQLVRRSALPAAAGSRDELVDFALGDAAGQAFADAGRPDVLIHLAWGGLPNYDSAHHVDQELPAHVGWLTGMVRAGLPHVVVAGTCFEYGLQQGELREDMPTRPANAYGIAKDTLRRSLEALAEAHPAMQRFALTWARLFYMHGEGQAPNALWPQLRAAVARGDSSFPMSGGDQQRDYLPVAEVARRLVGLALHRHGSGIVNICSGRPVAVRALVDGWIASHGWAIRPELGHYPYSPHEQMAFWGNPSKFDRCCTEAR